MHNTLLRRWTKDERGGAAILFALAMPMLVPAVGAAVDYSRMVNMSSRLQKAADAAAIATARELSMSNSADDNRFRAVARSVVNANLGLPEADTSMTVEPVATANRSGFTVKVGRTYTPSGVGAYLMSERTISASATAQRKGAGKMCVLVLSLKDANEGGALKLEGASQIIGQDCGTFSNSTNKDGIEMKSGTTLQGSIVCSSGGIKRDAGTTIASEHLTDCPKVDNPLADRVSPTPGACVLNKDGKADKHVIETSQDLFAGTYCGGIEIKKSAVVTLRPKGADSVVIVKDGTLKVVDTAKLTGRGVGIAFAGSSAAFEFTGTSTVDLHAPIDGPLAGILFFGSPQAPDWLEYKITSDNARVLVGTIYIPKGLFTVDAKNPVADLSAYTALIVTKLNLKDSPKLTLNTNYFQTMVPVSKGISNFGGSVNLTN